MRFVNLEEFWDNKNQEASELYGVASLLFGDKFQIIFDKFVFAKTDPDNPRFGRLYDSNGNELFDRDIEFMAPMIKTVDKEVVGYIIGDIKFASKLCIKKMLGDNTVYIHDIPSLFEFISSQKDFVDVLLEDGKLGLAEVIWNKSDIGNGTSYVYNNQVYFPINRDDGIINHLECTK